MIDKKVLTLAKMVAESQDKPSYNDVLKLDKIFPQDNSEDLMTPEEYEQLSDIDKQNIFDLSQGDWDKIMDGGSLNGDDSLVKKGIIKPTQKDEKKEKVFVTYTECIYKPKDDARKHIIENPNKKGDYVYNITNIEPGEYDVNNEDEKSFNTMEEAKAFLAQRMKEAEEKYGIKAEDFKEAIPPEVITKVDPGAYGFRYMKIDAKGEKLILKGMKKADKEAGREPDKQYDEILKETSFVYYIYRATAPVPKSDFMSEIAQALAWVDDPEGFKAMREKQKAREELMKQREQKRKEMFDQIKKTLDDKEASKKDDQSATEENPFDDNDDDFEIGDDKQGDDNFKVTTKNDDIEKDWDAEEEEQAKRDEEKDKEREDYNRERFGNEMDDDDDLLYGQDDDEQDDEDDFDRNDDDDDYDREPPEHIYSWDR